MTHMATNTESLNRDLVTSAPAATAAIAAEWSCFSFDCAPSLKGKVDVIDDHTLCRNGSVIVAVVGVVVVANGFGSPIVNVI